MLPFPYYYSMSYRYNNGTYGNECEAYDPGSTASCSEAIKTLFTWVPLASDPNQPLPQSAIVIENCTVSARAGEGVTGSCSTGFGGDGQSSSTGGVSGTQYTGHSSPGASFTVQDTPSASSTPSRNHLGDASVSYSASASPITIQLTGPIQDSSGNWDILVGQGCSASLVGIPNNYTYTTEDCIVSDYQWKVGGTTFQSWTGTTIPSSYVDGPGPLDIDTPSWYWNDLEQTTKETVSCTATVTPPAGEGSPFTVTATKQVTVLRPNWKATGTGGTMQVNSAYPRSNGSIRLWAGPLPGSSLGAIINGGMIWNATITSPNPTLFGDGSIAIAQIITPNESYTFLDASQAVITHSEPNNGQTGLDAFPYPLSTTPPTYLGGDAPGFSLDNHIVTAHVGDAFTDYLMYMPPGGGQWVPLATFNWSTNGSASIPSTGNWADFTGSAGTVTPSGSDVPFTQSNSFPSWTQTDPFIPF